jgi:hypothetical protein
MASQQVSPPRCLPSRAICCLESRRVGLVLFHDYASLCQGMGMALRLAVPWRDKDMIFLDERNPVGIREGCVPAFA